MQLLKKHFLDSGHRDNGAVYRLFFGIPLPADLQDEISSLSRPVPDFRWTSPSNLHITITFLGDCPPETMLDITDAINERWISEGPMHISLHETSVWPAGRRSILVQAVRAEGLARRKKQLDELMRDCGLEVEARRFRPHITLGRFGPHAAAMVQGLLKERRLQADFGATDLVLFSSQLRPEGPLYSEEGRFAF